MRDHARTNQRDAIDELMASPGIGQSISSADKPLARHAEGSTMEFADRAPFYWGNLTWPELKEAARRKPVVIQPIGATEQHGFHLPLNTDNFIVTRLCDAAARRAPDEMLILPVVPFA